LPPPIPELAPVTIATLPSIAIVEVFSVIPNCSGVTNGLATRYPIPMHHTAAGANPAIVTPSTAIA
jgi:hypothetical protein